jgi:putative DNA primase/helicase
MDFQQVRDQARGRWHDILCGIGVDSKYLTGKHSACPVCGGKDRFRFDDKNGKGGWICSACGAGDGFMLVSRLKKISLVEAKQVIEPLLPKASARPIIRGGDERRSRERAEEFWSNTSQLVDGDPVQLYLTQRLGQSFDSLSIRSGLMRHPSDKVKEYPVMAALVSDPSGNCVSVHRTFLHEDGRKAEELSPSKMLMQGTIPHGSAIRLMKATSHMGIAEGIETALAAFLMTGIPTWSVISAPLMKSWRPPKGVKKLTIFSDNDVNFTGQAAAYDLARQLVMQSGIKVDVRIPAITGEDWADVWKRKREEGI